MFRRLRINAQERAVSSDINRLQAFAARGFNETMKHALLVGTSDVNLGLYSDVSSVTNPVAHKILRGLLVRPAVGSFNLTIDSGVIFIIDPTSISADDSVCVPVKTDGVASGALTITPNASGSDRIDVIECALDTTPTIVTNNRDVFDATTGLFTATTVTKEVEQKLVFRVRQGTPGLGFPGTVAGWAPLAVALVPSATGSNDGVTFWDVRRLAEDQIVSPFDVVQPATMASVDALLDRTSSTSWALSGTFRGSYAGRRIGGKLRRGSPGTDAESLNLNESGNKAGAYVEPLSTTTSYFVYLVLPFGLPRWSRYTDASSGLRVPREPKGIPILTQVAPLPDGTPSSPISIANIFGAGATTTDGIFVLVAKNTESFANTMCNVWSSGRTQHFAYGTQDRFSPSLPMTLTSPGYGRFVPPAGRIPQNAKAVFMNFQLQMMSLPINTAYRFKMDVRISMAGTTGTSPTQRDGDWTSTEVTWTPTASAANFMTMGTPVIRIPLPPSMNGAPRLDPLIFNVVYNEAAVSANQAFAWINGFEF